MIVRVLHKSTDVPRPREVIVARETNETRFLEESLIRRTERGEFVRSKSELVIAEAPASTSCSNSPAATSTAGSGRSPWTARRRTRGTPASTTGAGVGRLDERMFVCRALGRSMEPRIHDGDYVVFRAKPAGTRQGRIVLVQYRGAADPDTGGSYTVKRYSSEKVAAEGDDWRHALTRPSPGRRTPPTPPP